MPHWKVKSVIEERRIDAGLWCFSANDPASSRGKTYYCYLLATQHGNLLIHPPDAPGCYRQLGARLDELGGVQFLFFTHAGDASPAATLVIDRWSTDVLVHRADAAEIGRRIGRPVANGFTQAYRFDAEIEILSFPGHTPGYSCLLRNHGGTKYLFGGHLLVQSRSGWNAAASREAFLESVRSVRQLESVDADYLMPEHTWSDAGSVAPLPFGSDARRIAVASALDYLMKRAARG